ncbi:cytidyltransferase [Marinilactibacillus psychrotolerans]|uniref:UDP-2,4-diacetamido-2,4, 6-trideoxy-beta-L-altropyranose hydrolase n=1 Tax=Marinilactibacillus psychrotolerans TaxID=191770 RepID=UPI001C7DBF9F|nr:UDP-2,4-diacetamido-2,4,6-trideoxy-beta-L-altropyranose hydrolase [Marinilactibacillus psychrotolerans]GEQ32289.1 cytidyltransferase [Marinilactibacillus psychrotolerans]
MNILAVIPARGGSKGIPRKNVRFLAGNPLISYAIKNALKSEFSVDVCVSTDDFEIERVAIKYGAEVVNRTEELSSDEITLDPVIYDAFTKMSKQKNKEYDYVITLQATSPLLTVEILDNAIKECIENNFDTIISTVNQPHLHWVQSKEGEFTPGYKERLNRQYLPKRYVETGAFLITKAEWMKPTSRIGKNVSVFEVPESQSIDIDTPADWWIAEKQLTKKNILIRVDGYSGIGLGHVYRGLALAYNLIDHNVQFVLSEKSDLGIEKIKNSHFPFTIIKSNKEIGKLISSQKIDIIINDILNTTEDYVTYLKKLNVRVINFEDLGDGADSADIVINDLYAPQRNGDHYFWGSDYYIIRDEFLLSESSVFNEVVKNVLVIFGGADPSNLTLKVFNAIQSNFDYKNIQFNFIVGPGYPHYNELKNLAKKSSLNINVIRDVKVMTEYMRNADIALSSQGRTMLELASMGVPTILLAQNQRELKHEFGYLNNGFINLGLGEYIEEETVKDTLEWLIKSEQVRQQMHDQMKLKDLKNGLKRVLQIILN